MDYTQEINDWHLVLSHENDFMMNFVKEGDLFIDIGAHVGCWALKLSQFYRKAICFEPNPMAFHALKKNVEINSLNNVVCENLAVGSENKKAQLTLYTHPSHSTIFEHHPMENHTGPVQGVIDINVIRLDDYILESNDRISLIKIDVEGFEVEVVKGAIETIRKHKPNLCIEIHSPENEKTIRELLPFVNFETKSNGVQPYLVSIQ